ncbi:hypothetical protein ACOMHN_015579 [Nucella lapillus]
MGTSQSLEREKSSEDNVRQTQARAGKQDERIDQPEELSPDKDPTRAGEGHLPSDNEDSDGVEQSTGLSGTSPAIAQSCSARTSEDPSDARGLVDLADDDGNPTEEEMNSDASNTDAGPAFGEITTKWSSAPQPSTRDVCSVDSGFSSINSAIEDDHRCTGEVLSGYVSEDADNKHTDCAEIDDDDVLEFESHSKGEQQDAGVELNFPQDTSQTASSDPALTFPWVEIPPGQTQNKTLGQDQHAQKRVLHQGPKHVRFSGDSLSVKKLGSQSVPRQKQSSPPQGGSVVSEREPVLSACESTAEEDARLSSEDSTKAVLPIVVIEDYDAKSGVLDGKSNGHSNPSQKEDMPALKSLDLPGRITLSVPQERHHSSNAGQKDVSSESDGQTRKLNAVGEDSSERNLGKKRRGPQEFLLPKSGQEFVSLKDETNSQPATEESVTHGDEDLGKNTATHDPQSMGSLVSKTAGHSDAPTSSEVQPRQISRQTDTLKSSDTHTRQTVSQTCFLKTPPFPEGEEHVCEECGQFFAMDEHLQAHVITHPAVFMCPGFRCGGCGAKFHEMRNLHTHCDVSRKRKGTCCWRCRQWFSTCDDLYRHRQERTYRREEAGRVLGHYGFLVARSNRYYLRRL